MYDASLTPEDNLARHGFSKNGLPTNAPKEADATIHDLDYFTGAARQNTLSPDDDARESARLVDADVDPALLARREAARATAFRATGQHERAEEAARHAAHLNELHKLTIRNKARETLRVRDLSSNREFTDAVMTGDFEKANAMMIAVVRDKNAPYALRIACVGALKQIAALVGTDDGELNDSWLSRVTGVPRSSCKELIDAQSAVGTDIAMLLLGTESEDRKGVRDWAKKKGECLSSAVDSLKQFYTARMIAHAGECEEAARIRKISLSEADVLDAVGMNNSEGRTQLVKMPLKAGQLWLATMLDASHEAAERTGGIVCKGKLVKPFGPAVPTKRLLTQRQLDAGNVREL